MTDFKNLDDLNLPPAFIADIFKNQLVLIEKQTVVSKNVKQAAEKPLTNENTNIIIESKQELKFFGGNKKQISIIVNDPNALYLGDLEMEILTKMLTALKLSINDVAIVNMATKFITLEELLKNLNPSYALFFGMEPFHIGLPMKFPQYQIQHWGDCTYLYAHSLSSLTNNLPQTVEIKKTLWAALKTIFAV